LLLSSSLLLLAAAALIAADEHARQRHGAPPILQNPATFASLPSAVQRVLQSPAVQLSLAATMQEALAGGMCADFKKLKTVTAHYSNLQQLAGEGSSKCRRARRGTTADAQDSSGRAAQPGATALLRICDAVAALLGGRVVGGHATHLRMFEAQQGTSMHVSGRHGSTRRQHASNSCPTAFFLTTAHPGSCPLLHHKH
jgi:hypothetical protein